MARRLLRMLPPILQVDSRPPALRRSAGDGALGRLRRVAFQGRRTLDRPGAVTWICAARVFPLDVWLKRWHHDGALLCSQDTMNLPGAAS